MARSNDLGIQLDPQRGSPASFRSECKEGRDYRWKEGLESNRPSLSMSLEEAKVLYGAKSVFDV